MAARAARSRSQAPPAARTCLMLALLLATAHAATAAPAYVGCFQLAGLQERAVAALPAAAAANLAAACAARCAALRHPLAALQLGGRCGCSSVVPDSAAAAPAAACSEAALAAPGATAAALFYSNTGELAAPAPAGAARGAAPLPVPGLIPLSNPLASPPHPSRHAPPAHPPARLHLPDPDPAARCRLSNLGPLGPGNVKASYNPGRGSFTPGGELALGLVGTDGGRFVTADGDALYGMFQWDVQPSGAAGAVTGAYVSAAGAAAGAAARWEGRLPCLKRAPRGAGGGGAAPRPSPPSPPPSPSLPPSPPVPPAAERL
jgi:hypothetical protein